ncbi:MAG: DNA topoisomerase I [Methanomassiliicoccales archaeon]|nr:DNA topoisomerase I [Methanomassiliicoccales archaeon]MDD1755587.1 DNA topoisomerase I [Methanomassiliicoccales archaeon]
MKRLVISEKSNAAARIATILSSGNKRSIRDRGVQVFSFERGGDEWFVIGLRGHVIELDYPREMNDWQKTPAKQLVYAAPVKSVKAHNIISILQEQARDADEIIIATDFDREGELIGMETVDMLDVDPAKIKRARFSALTKVEIERAFQELTRPDERLAEAAECRQIIDLAWGAALTRFISLASGQVGSNFLSVGRVQSPTLSLIVDKHNEILSFVPKPYWNIQAKFRKEIEFRGRHEGNPFWEEAEASGALERCKGASTAEVKEYLLENKEEYPPPPFNTTMLLAEAVKMGMSASLAMKVAEDLYTSGYISYPRTDNTVYPRSLGMRTILEKLRESDFKQEAEEVLAQETIRPSRGRVETTDHPPIYPTEAATKKELKGEKWRIYELVVRRFLATVAPSCKAEHRHAKLAIKDEVFEAKGYKILAPGWRRYYPYFRVTEVDLPSLNVGEKVEVLGLDMERLETLPPRRYTQGTLIQEMERLGLGTKSTRHEIVQKLYDRKYVVGNDLVPTESGIAVAMSLEKHAKTITESKMTAHLEKDMEEIADGKALLPEVVRESQDMLSDVIDAMEKHREGIGDEIRSALMEQSYVGKCPDCEGELRVKRSRKGEFISCSNYPECKRAFPKPRGAKLEATEEACEKCKSPVVRLIRRGSPPQKHCINPDCESNKQATSVGTCPECGSTLRLLFSRAGKRFIGCSAYPNCKRTYPLPQFGTLRMTGEVCDACRAPIALVMNRGRPWKFCVNMECPKREKKAERKAAKEGKAKPGSETKKPAAKPKKKAASKPKAAAKKEASEAKPKKPARSKSAKKKK